MAALYTLIDVCNNLVAYFKKSNLRSKLSKTLKQNNATRWNSIYHCLLSISEIVNKVIDLLKQKDTLQKVASISKTFLKQLIDLLTKFQKTTLVLNNSKNRHCTRLYFGDFNCLSI